MSISRLVPSLVLAATAVLMIPGRAAEPDPKALTYTFPENIKWNTAANQDNAVLQGDPSQPGLYVVLTRWHKGNNSRPHSHPNNRYITVLSGTWWVGTGANYDPAGMVPMKTGTHVVHYGNELHYDGAKDEDCTLLIVGMGPANNAKGK
jgi:hypothetical protein